jgi:radical SAM protein (TIGR01212 family)
MRERFYSFNSYLRKIFGERVHRISIDAGFDCPNLDGTLNDDGCIYCNNKAFGVYARANKPIEEQIKDSIKFYQARFGVKKFIIYFQSFTNTYAMPEVLKGKYDIIKKFPQIVGLSISTRPDCVDEERIELISQYKRDYLVWIEYGLQTTHNHILHKINRQHTYEDFLRALALSRKYNINVGVHMILGLPLAGYQDMMEDAQKICRLDIQGIKFHILHTLKGTELEEMHKRGEISLLSRAEYVRILCDFLESIPSSWVILRLVSTAFSDYLVAPSWINQRAGVIEDIKRELEHRGTHQGCKTKNHILKT